MVCINDKEKETEKDMIDTFLDERGRFYSNYYPRFRKLSIMIFFILFIFQFRNKERTNQASISKHQHGNGRECSSNWNSCH